jgi:hypothetical protein
MVRVSLRIDMSTIYATNVRFMQYEGWSRPYTYKSYNAYAKGSAVLVEKGSWYNIGKVVEDSVEGYEFNPRIDYKFIIKEIQV